MLETNGFELIPQVLSTAECDTISSHATEVLLSGAGSRRLLESPWCRHLANTLRTHQQIKTNLPENAVAVQCTLFDKSREKNWLVPLHQDLAIPVREKTNAPNCSGWSEKEGVVFVQPPPGFLTHSGNPNPPRRQPRRQRPLKSCPRLPPSRPSLHRRRRNAAAAIRRIHLHRHPRRRTPHAAASAPRLVQSRIRSPAHAFCISCSDCRSCHLACNRARGTTSARRNSAAS